MKDDLYIQYQLEEDARIEEEKRQRMPPEQLSYFFKKNAKQFLSVKTDIPELSGPLKRG